MTELYSLVLNLNVDCVEFTSDSILACGLYQLIDNERKGGVSLLRFEKGILKNLHYLESCGVFGLKWITNRPRLITVTADGSLNLLDLNFDRLNNIQSNLLTDKMLLSVDLSNVSSDSIDYVASDNDGYLHRGVVDSQAFYIAESWPVHRTPDSQAGSEVWCCSFDVTNRNVIYSGADDCKWKLWDVRDTLNAKITNSYHKAGVTSIVAHPVKENCILTGSYDDFLCLWDVRNAKNPLGYVNLGGGVWKIKFHPINPDIILCACMYNGWTILNYDATNNFTVESSKNLNGALLYGVDWYPDDPKYFACCTFYDSNVKIFQT